MLIHVLAWDGREVTDLGYDTLENFEAVRHLTIASGNRMFRGGFYLEGHEYHHFMAVLVND